MNFDCDLAYYYLYPSVASSFDILRVSKFYQFYRYQMDITRIFRTDIYGIVGDITELQALQKICMAEQNQLISSTHIHLFAYRTLDNTSLFYLSFFSTRQRFIMYCLQ